MYAAWSDFSAAVLKHLMVKMSRFGGKKEEGSFGLTMVEEVVVCFVGHRLILGVVNFRC